MLLVCSWRWIRCWVNRCVHYHGEGLCTRQEWSQENHHLCTLCRCSHVRYGSQPREIRSISAGEFLLCCRTFSTSPERSLRISWDNCPGFPILSGDSNGYSQAMWTKASDFFTWRANNQSKTDTHRFVIVRLCPTPVAPPTALLPWPRWSTTTSVSSRVSWPPCTPSQLHRRQSMDPLTR